MTQGSHASTGSSPSEEPRASLPGDEWATAGAPEGDDPDGMFASSMIGRFVVIGELGRGAMGQVLRAYDPKLLREVAIKLVRVRDQAASARMLREAQALAQLSHPNVVSIYDVGEQQGTVFIAMEYVPGRTLRQWLEGERPDWRKAVALVQAAGQGLAAAHRAGLVHRDVKPDNILIADDGRVRVVDFGLARAGSMEGELFDEGDAAASWSDPSSSLTRTGTVMGTLAYMAPEQHMGAIADARSDQYSLCVTLFELLYGTRPFQGTGEELCVAKLRGKVDVPAVPRVPRVLVQAILRGLSAPADDRWPSIDALLAELARDPSRARRRAVLGIGGLVIAAAGFGVHRLDRARTAAACTADGEAIAGVWNDDARTAVREGLIATGSAVAESTADQLMPWLDRYAQDWQEGRTEACLATKLRETSSPDALERAEWCFEDRLTELEGFVDELKAADAEAVYLAVPGAASLTSLEQCSDAELLGRLPAPPAEEHDAVRTVRASLSHASALMHAGRFARALDTGTEALQQAQALAWPPLVAAARLRVARALSRTGRLADAEAAAEASFIESAANGSWDVATDAASLLVTIVGHQQQRHVDGLRWSRLRAIAVANLGGEDELREAEYQHGLALVLLEAGELAAALAADQAALEIAEQRLGDEHPTTAAILLGLALTHQTAGEYADAKPLYLRSLAIREAALGREHPDVAQSLISMGSMEISLGDLDAARAMLERALAIYSKVQGPEHPNVGVSLFSIGSVEATAGNFPRARASFERSVEVLERALGPDHIDVARSLRSLASIHAMSGELAQARTLFERALAIAEKTLGQAHPGLEPYLDGAANVHSLMGEHAAAVALRERALAVAEAGQGTDNIYSAATLDNLASDYTALGRYEDARAAYQRSSATKLRDLGPDHAAHVVSELGLGKLELLQHDPTAAITHFERAVALTTGGPVPAELAEARFGLARALWSSSRDRGRARELAGEAAEALRDPTLGADALRTEIEAWLSQHPLD